MDFDLVVRGGTVVDGTGAPRRRVDLGIRSGRIAEVGDLASSSASEVIDANGLIVAPGVIDPHTHYDAQIHWDPHCTNSGTHGVTTVMVGNCGFGFAPCIPELRDRYMQMMEQTEQVPFTAMRAGLDWEWETFPEWMDHLRRIPKGINIVALMPINPLLIYVMGLEAAKSRPATEAERAEMRRLFHEAMAVGASGFGFSWLGETNNHIDADGRPMPSDIMAIDEALNLADVLRERNEGVIQMTTEVAGIAQRRDMCAELARRSGRPVLYNALQLFPGQDGHVDILAFLDRCEAEGLPVFAQSFVSRVWTEFTVENYNSWAVHPVFRFFTDASQADKVELARSNEFRARVKEEYDLDAPQHGGTKFYEFTLVQSAGANEFEAFEGQTIAAIADSLGSHVVDTFFDILAASNLQAQFTHLSRFVTDPTLIGSVLRHPRVIPGGSDGGAHVKFVSNGQWSTDFLTWVARDNDQLTLEEMHSKMSKFPADILGLTDRGSIEVGKAADLMIYDLDSLGYEYGRYTTVHDLPDGGWRKFVGVEGLRYTVVNGRVSMVDGKPVNSDGGQLLTGCHTLTASSS